jgi:hypothetical protein
MIKKILNFIKNFLIERKKKKELSKKIQNIEGDDPFIYK